MWLSSDWKCCSDIFSNVNLQYYVHRNRHQYCHAYNNTQCISPCVLVDIALCVRLCDTYRPKSYYSTFVHIGPSLYTFVQPKALFHFYCCSSLLLVEDLRTKIPFAAMSTSRSLLDQSQHKRRRRPATGPAQYANRPTTEIKGGVPIVPPPFPPGLWLPSQPKSVAAPAWYHYLAQGNFALVPSQESNPRPVNCKSDAQPFVIISHVTLWL